MAAMSSPSFCPGLPPKMPTGLLSAFPSVSGKMSKFRAFPSASALPSILVTASPLNTCSAPQTRPSTMKSTVSRAVPWSRNPLSRHLQLTHPRGAPMTLKRLFSSRLRRLPRLRVVVALAINRRHLRAHTSQIRGKLAAMMNGVVQPHHHESHRGPLHHSAKIDDLDQLVAGNFRQRLVILREPLLIPGRNFSGCLDVFRNHCRAGVKHTVDHGLDKAVVRGRNVARQLDRASCGGLRAVPTLVRGNRFENFLRRAALILHRSHLHVLKQEHCLICCHRISHLCPPECVWCSLWARGGHWVYPGLHCEIGCANPFFVARGDTRLHERLELVSIGRRTGGGSCSALRITSGLPVIRPQSVASSEWSFQARASQLSGCPVARQSG